MATPSDSGFSLINEALLVGQPVFERRIRQPNGRFIATAGAGLKFGLGLVAPARPVVASTGAMSRTTMYKNLTAAADAARVRQSVAKQGLA
jgi:hypothetical protein